MESTAVKLRRAFKYPTDGSDEDDAPLAIDEEEQERLISKMRAENDKQNEKYKKVFLAMPLVSVVTYLPAMVLSSSMQAKLVALLNITSLLATAYHLAVIPIGQSGRPHKHLVRGPIQRSSRPVYRYLPYLNGVFSLVLGLNALIWPGRRGVHEGFWALCLLPPAVFFVTLFAEKALAEVDVEELEGLKYGYKGA